MAKPAKRSVAVLIQRDGLILSVRRPAHDDELPGVWGLPAGTYRESETLAALIERIGREKLGVRLVPIRKLAEGVQARPSYRLQMELWEVTMAGNPVHAEYQWAPVEILEAGMACGSLCCELALKGKGRAGL